MMKASNYCRYTGKMYITHIMVFIEKIVIILLAIHKILNSLQNLLTVFHNILAWILEDIQTPRE